MDNRAIDNLIQLMDKDTFVKCSSVREVARDYEAHGGTVSSDLMAASSVCDIGKMYISNEILNKRGNLTESEFELVKMHPYIGYRICLENGVDKDIATIVLYHHGKNPYHLQTIPVPSESLFKEARKLYTFDVYSALTSTVVYRPRIAVKEAINIMENESQHYHLFDDDVMSFLRAQA